MSSKKSSLSNWTCFVETPTTKADVEKAITNIPKRFHFKPKGVTQPTPLLTKGVPTQLSESMGLLSGGDAKQLANYLRRYFFREVVYVRFQIKLPKKHIFYPKWFFVSLAVSDMKNHFG